MKKPLKIFSFVLGAITLFVSAFLGYFTLTYPEVKPAQEIFAERTPERVARGAYLANHVTVCIDCHSTREWNKFSGPIVRGTEGMGGQEFNEQIGGVPGNIYSSNITPAGIRDYTDGELLRAFTSGVTKHNRALFPLMPYIEYSHISREDAYAIVAYIRSLPPIENGVKESRLNFPMNFIVKTIPLQEYTPAPEPDKSDTVAYGKYLLTISGCAGCHTPAVKGEPIPGMDLAGGFEFLFPGGVIRSLNITPDKETGLGGWTKEDFIARFKAFAGEELRNVTLNPTDFNTPMPWTMYAGMTEEDLGAIYSYLRTVNPVPHQVSKFTPNQSVE